MTGGPADATNDALPADPEPLPTELQPVLAGLDPTARAAREALLRHLLGRGRSVTALLEAHAENRLAMLPVSAVLGDDGGLTLAAIADDAGVPLAAVSAARHALGLPVDPDGAVYGETASHLARLLAVVLGAGMPLPTLLEFNHVIGAGVAATAAGARDAVMAALGRIDPGGTEFTRALRAAEVTEALLPVLSETLTVTLTEHLREVARREVATTVVAGGAPGMRDVTVGFADLVGFTALGESVPADRLGAVAARLADLARDALAGECDLVKTLGDGVMLAAARPGDVVDTLLSLTAAVTADGDLPELRAGATWGPALPRAGDWYGAVVNRASRLAGLAEPGTVVVDDAWVRAADDGNRLTPLGEREVRGLRAPVAVWRVT